MEIFRFVFRHFWLIAIVFMLFGLATMNFQLRREYPDDLEERHTARRFRIQAAIVLLIPWIVMGIGIVIGGVPTMLHYFRPQDGNPYVTAWWLSIFVLWFAGLIWVFQGNEEKLHKYYLSKNAKHPFLNALPPKLLYVLSVLPSAAGFIFCWLIDLPVEEFSFLYE